MAVETVKTITSPPEFIESESKLYLDQLKNAIGGLKGIDLTKFMGSDFVAGLGGLTQEAINKAGGLGAYEPYLQTAGSLAGQAADQLKQAGILQGQAGTLAGQASNYMGPDAYKQIMSPYQQDVIGTTLSEYDIQAQKGAQGVPAAAIAAGAFGGGREGVQRAEYLSSSDRNRAALQANLLQQGFGQAQQLAGQAFGQQQAMANQQNQLAQSALGLGQAYSGLGQQQLGFAQAAPALAGQEISALTTLGGIQQAQQQAQLQAQAQLAQQQAYQPLTTAQQYGSGIMGLISGYPGSTQVGQVPVPGIAQTALGAGATLAGIYGALT